MRTVVTFLRIYKKSSMRKTEIFKEQLVLLNSYVSSLECFRWLEVN